ncbi:MAG: hypothetical protein ACRDPW_09000 [Mycobacteriales bacterium]
MRWIASALIDPASPERAMSTLDTFVAPAEIDRVFGQWRDSV